MVDALFVLSVFTGYLLDMPQPVGRGALSLGASVEPLANHTQAKQKQDHLRDVGRVESQGTGNANQVLRLGVKMLLPYHTNDNATGLAPKQS